MEKGGNLQSCSLKRKWLGESLLRAAGRTRRSKDGCGSGGAEQRRRETKQRQQSLCTEHSRLPPAQPPQETTARLHRFQQKEQVRNQAKETSAPTPGGYKIQELSRIATSDMKEKESVASPHFSEQRIEGIERTPCLNPYSNVEDSSMLSRKQSKGVK